jgi:multicomponent Na+:H+ antiporter subunit G
MILELATIAFIVTGAAFMALGTAGLVRLPDVYNRMHSTTKATTLGASSTLLAAAVHFRSGASLTALVAVMFLFLTAPTGAHMISRAAERMGVEMVQE